MNACAVGGCSTEPVARGWCRAHYIRWYRYGDPIASKARPTPAERFWAKVTKTDTCWLWNGAKIRGYGSFRLDGAARLAHRVSYTWANDPIPDGFELDHKCHVPACVNPAHLQVVTTAQNHQNLSGPQRNTKSGVRGVSVSGDRWRVTVKHEGCQHYGGTFTSIQHAEDAAIALRNRLYTNNLIDRERLPECSKGHRFTPENTYITNRGHRTCRACNRDYARARRSTTITERWGKA